MAVAYDLPKTVYYFRHWKLARGREYDFLRAEVRSRAPVEPSAGIADQSVKTAGNATEVGFDGGKQIFCRKRHIGLRYLEIITGCVHGARRSDQAGNKIAFAVDG